MLRKCTSGAYQVVILMLRNKYESVTEIAVLANSRTGKVMIDRGQVQRLPADNAEQEPSSTPITLPDLVQANVVNNYLHQCLSMFPSADLSSMSSPFQSINSLRVSLLENTK